MEIHAPAPAHQSALQHAVRALATLAFVAVCGSGPLCYFAMPHVKTLSSIPLPRPTWTETIAGGYAKRLEQHLRETSPLTYEVRGVHAENLWAYGWLDAPRIHLGKDGWTFLTDELVFQEQRFHDQKEVRRETYRELHLRLTRLGVATLAVLIPDKTRLHQDLLADGTRYPRGREALGALLQDDLRSAGFAVLSLHDLLRAERAAAPDRPLWYKRDSHWCGLGMSHAANAIVAELARLGWLERLGPREALVPLAARDPGILGDMAQILGIREKSTLGLALSEPRDGYSLALPNGGGVLPRLQPDAPWALAGTSFSREGLDALIPMAELARSGSTWRLDAASTHQAWFPIAALLEAMERIARRELRARVLIWEIPERLEVEEPWDEIRKKVRAP